MSQMTAQSRCTVFSPDVAPDAGSEVRRRAGFFGTRSGSSAYLRHRRRSAYTLIEVLIVASIVVLMLGMALPVFRAITGSRSEAGASNIIASMLARARTDAIGLDKPIGVAFVYNPSTQQNYLAEVGFAECPVFSAGLTIPPLGYFYAPNPALSGSPTYFIYTGATAYTVPTALTIPSALTPVNGPPLEILANTELVPLPNGIGVQTVFNCQSNNTGARLTDGYLNFGVILFDGSGRLTSQNYGVSRFSKLSTVSNLNADYPAQSSGNGIYYPYPVPTNTPYQYGVPSQYGLVVFQREAFVAQSFPTADPAYTQSTDSNASAQVSAYTTGTPSQQAEENWLDQNATPLLIDRYTGTLIKGD